MHLLVLDAEHVFLADEVQLFLYTIDRSVEATSSTEQLCRAHRRELLTPLKRSLQADCNTHNPPASFTGTDCTPVFSRDPSKTLITLTYYYRDPDRRGPGHMAHLLFIPVATLLSAARLLARYVQLQPSRTGYTRVTTCMVYMYAHNLSDA